MRGRPRKQIAVIHNELARSHTDLSSLGYRLMVLLAVRATIDGELLTHKLTVREYKSALGFTGRSAYELLEDIADEMLTLDRAHFRTHPNLSTAEGNA